MRTSPTHVVSARRATHVTIAMAPATMGSGWGVEHVRGLGVAERVVSTCVGGGTWAVRVRVMVVERGHMVGLRGELGGGGKETVVVGMTSADDGTRGGVMTGEGVT